MLQKTTVDYHLAKVTLAERAGIQGILLNDVLFSDEAHFNFDGVVNKLILRVWALIVSRVNRTGP